MYTLLYLIVALIIIIFFYFLYRILGIDFPWYNSVYIFWGLESGTNISRNLVIFETIFRNVLFVAWTGSFLSKLLIPVNPILFANNIVYNNENKLRVRYWIMVPYKQYLYNVNIRLILTDGPFINRGVNKTHTLWEYNENFNIMRGVRYIELLPEDSATIFHITNTIENPFITVRIQGQNKTGIIFYAQRMYSIPNNMLKGYDFVYTFQPECIKLAQKLGYQVEGIKPKKHLVRYENFDKVYSCCSQENQDETNTNNDIFTLEQIVYGQYYGIKIYQRVHQRFVDMLNYTITFVLNKDRFFCVIRHSIMIVTKDSMCIF